MLLGFVWAFPPFSNMAILTFLDKYIIYKEARREEAACPDLC